MLLIRPRPSPVRQSRSPRTVSLDALLHLIVAPFYILLAYLGATYTSEHGLYIILKEILFYASMVLVVTMLLPRFGRIMNDTKKPRQ